MKPVLENLTQLSSSFAHILVQKAAKSSITQEVSLWVNHYRYPKEPYNETKILDQSDSKTTEGFISSEEFKISQSWFDALSKLNTDELRRGYNLTTVGELIELNLNQILTKLKSLSSPKNQI